MAAVPALLESRLVLARSLSASCPSLVVVGSMARWLLDVDADPPRDVDVAVPGEPEALSALSAALGRLGAWGTRRSARPTVRPDLSPQRFRTPLGPLDVFVMDPAGWSDVERRTTIVGTGAGRVRVLAASLAAGV